MTVKDLKIEQIYEVVGEFYSGYSAYEHPELESILTNGVLKVGTLMKYVKYGEHAKSFNTALIYGFHFVIDGKIVENSQTDDGIFWFSEKELS